MDTIPDQLSYLVLAVLALVDSTSIGTLVVPVLLLVTAGASMSAGRIAVRTLYYLLVIGLFYFALGLALVAGAMPLFERFGDALVSTPALAVYVAIGVGLVVWSFYVDPKAIRKRGGDPEESGRRWITRARDAAGSFRALTGLALLAGVIEAASMVPYLAAIGIIVDSGAGIGRAAVILVAYCTVMSLPGIVLRWPVVSSGPGWTDCSPGYSTGASAMPPVRSPGRSGSSGRSWCSTVPRNCCRTWGSPTDSALRWRHEQSP